MHTSARALAIAAATVAVVAGGSAAVASSTGQISQDRAANFGRPGPGMNDHHPLGVAHRQVPRATATEVDRDADDDAPTTLGIRARQAVRVAQRQVPGATVTKVERDDEGTAAWEIDLQRRNVEFKVAVDPSTSRVLSVEQEAAEPDDAEDD